MGELQGGYLVSGWTITIWMLALGELLQQGAVSATTTVMHRLCVRHRTRNCQC